MHLKTGIRKIIKSAHNPSLIRPAILRRLPSTLKVNCRAVSRKIGLIRTKYVRKKFENNEIGRQCFANEVLANQLFAGYPWMTPAVENGHLWFSRQFYPEKTRLDLVADNLPNSIKKKIASEVISIIFDIFFAGYAHRDIHANNFYWIEGGLKLIDFEWLQKYPSRPAFPLCYDVTGEGMESPGNTKNMGYNKDHPLSIKNVLGVPTEQALDIFRDSLKNKLRSVCSTFSTKDKRHFCNAKRIYSSFHLPCFSVMANEAQRNSEARLKKFGVDQNTFQNKTVLDLGSNIGGMLFEIQKYNPKYCTGIEYDADKILLAEQIAAFNGLTNTSFVTADIDSMSNGFLKDQYDIVFCLAIEAHVKNRPRLFKILSNLTRNTLYFEGNGKCNLPEVIQTLKQVGFMNIKNLGFSDDDCIASNNIRPILKAEKCQT